MTTFKDRHIEDPRDAKPDYLALWSQPYGPDGHEPTGLERIERRERENEEKARERDRFEGKERGQ